MTVYDPKTGQPVEIDEKAAVGGVLAGQYGFPKGERVPVVSPSGKVGSVPSEKVGAALTKGFRFPSDQEVKQQAAEKEFGGPVGEVEAGLAGALRGGTLGLSDLFLSGDPELKRKLAGLREANLNASTAGEIGGTAASLALAPEASGPGLASALGESATDAVAQITGKSLLGRVAAKAAGGATEGGIFGLGQFISDQALSDNPELDAEKVFAATGGAALTGGILGGTGELFATGLRKGSDLLMKSLGGKGLREALSDFAEQRALSTVGIGSDTKRFGLGNPEERSSVARYMLDKLPLTAGDNAASILDKAEAASSWHGENIGAIAQDIDSRGVAFDTPRFTARATQELLDPIANDPAKAQTYNALKNLIGGYQAYGPGGAAGPMSFQKAWELQSSLRQKLGLADSLFAARNELPKLRQLFRDEIISQANDVSPHFGDMLRAQSRDYRSSEVIQQMANRALGRQEMNNPYSLFDRMAAMGAGAMVGGPGGLVAAGGGLIANKLMRERGRSLVAVAADQLAQSGLLPKLASGIQKFVDAGIASGPVWGGTFRATLERALARGAENTLATHIQLAKSDPSYLSAVGLEDETPDQAQMLAEQAGKFAQVGSIVNQHDSKVDSGIGRIFGTQPGAAPTGDFDKVSPEQFAQQTAQIQAYQQNPDLLAQKTNTLQSISPSLAALTSATGTRAVAFLAQVMPKNPQPQTLPALAEPWKPDQAQLVRWSRYVGAIESPQTVLQHVKDGTVTKEEVQTLAAVYPQLLSDMQKKVTEQLASTDKRLSYLQKLSLSKFFGSPVGTAGDPQRFALLQQAHSVTVNQPPPPSATAGKVDGRQRVDQVASFQTQTERSEARASGAMS